MKVILSRKGFDSSYGGYPSLILPNGKLISLPIPGDSNDIPYSAVNSGCNNASLFSLMGGIRDHIFCGKRIDLTTDTCCHLDPDLVRDAYPRANGWRGCFGQAGAAQTVLEKSKVDAGDLILFFGWFNHYQLDGASLKPAPGSGKHILYGYMQIAEKRYTRLTDVPEWLSYHPHAREDRIKLDSNCIFIARERLTWNDALSGYGVFKYSKELDLTKEGLSRSKWALPDVFRDKKITYHSARSWKDGYFQSAHRGQEFVVEESNEVLDWAKRIIDKHM